MGLRSGSIVFVKTPICQHATNLSEFIAKQVSVSVRLVFETRAKCQDFVARFEDYGVPMPLTVPSAAPIQISSSANQDHLKTGKSESNLRLSGENWLTNLKFSSLMEMTKVHSSSQRSMLAHMSSTSKIEETGLENRCSNLPPLEADKHLPLFAPELSVPVTSPDVLQRVLSQANKVNVWWPLLRSSPFCLLAC